MSPSSFENVKDKWIPELRHYCPETPIILVGTKIDMRNDQAAVNNIFLRTRQLPKTISDGISLSNEFGATKFQECSALTQQGLSNVFAEAIRAATNKPKIKKSKKRSRCAIM
jgi:GTPase SAR1 family protein